MRFGLFVVRAFAGLAPAPINNVRGLAAIGVAITESFREIAYRATGDSRRNYLTNFLATFSACFDEHDGDRLADCN
jgi:hypothetical protein